MANIEYKSSTLTLPAAPEVVFPEDTSETITFTAGTVANTWCDWTEIVDNNSVTFTSKFATRAGRLTVIQSEVTSVASEYYMFQVAYGTSTASLTEIAQVRIYSGLLGELHKGAPSLGLYTVLIPAGQTVYYRMKAQTGSATVTVTLRYNLL